MEKETKRSGKNERLRRFSRQCASDSDFLKVVFLFVVVG